MALKEARAGLARVGLGQTAEQYPHVLSGGEQQRVALARALVPRPSVVLMDEPFSGLDVQLRTRMQEDTLALLRETRATSMIVTHHPEEAMRLGDRIVVMRAGRIVQAGRAKDLYRDPADLFVARLFSEINEIPWVVTGGALRTPVGTFSVPDIAEGERGHPVPAPAGDPFRGPGRRAACPHPHRQVPGRCGHRGGCGAGLRSAVEGAPA